MIIKTGDVCEIRLLSEAEKEEKDLKAKAEAILKEK